MYRKACSVILIFPWAVFTAIDPNIFDTDNELMRTGHHSIYIKVPHLSLFTNSVRITVCLLHELYSTVSTGIYSE